MSNRAFKQLEDIREEDVAAESARLHADLYTNLNRIAAENYRDPDAFQTKANAYVEGALSKTYPHNREKLRAYASMQVDQYYRAGIERKDKEQDARHLASFLDGAQAIVDQAGYLARAGDEAGLRAAQNELVAMLHAATGTRGADGASTTREYLSDGQANDWLSKYDIAISSNGLIREFEQARNKPAFIAALRKREVRGLTIGQRDTLADGFEADYRSDLAEARAAKAEAQRDMLFRRAQVEGEVKDVVSVLDAGYAVPRERVEAAAKSASAAGATDLAQEIYP